MEQKVRRELAGVVVVPPAENPLSRDLHTDAALEPRAGPEVSAEVDESGTEEQEGRTAVAPKKPMTRKQRKVARLRRDHTRGPPSNSSQDGASASLLLQVQQQPAGARQEQQHLQDEPEQSVESESGPTTTSKKEDFYLLPVGSLPGIVRGFHEVRFETSDAFKTLVNQLLLQEADDAEGHDLVVIIDSAADLCAFAAAGYAVPNAAYARVIRSGRREEAEVENAKEESTSAQEKSSLEAWCELGAHFLRQVFTVDVEVDALVDERKNESEELFSLVLQHVREALEEEKPPVPPNVVPTMSGSRDGAPGNERSSRLLICHPGEVAFRRDVAKNLVVLMRAAVEAMTSRRGNTRRSREAWRDFLFSSDNDIEGGESVAQKWLRPCVRELMPGEIAVVVKSTTLATTPDDCEKENEDHLHLQRALMVEGCRKFRAMAAGDQREIAAVAKALSVRSSHQGQSGLRLEPAQTTPEAAAAFLTLFGRYSEGISFAGYRKSLAFERTRPEKPSKSPSCSTQIGSDNHSSSTIMA